MKRTIAALTAAFILSCLSLSDARAIDARPEQWCGWYARHFIALIDPGKAFNRALEWVHWQRPCTEPHVGCIVVWSRGHGHGHVGQITGECHKVRGATVCPILSGNAGHGMVRTSMRSISNRVALREGPTHIAAGENYDARPIIARVRHHNRIAHTRRNHHDQYSVSSGYRLTSVGYRESLVGVP